MAWYLVNYWEDFSFTFTCTCTWLLLYVKLKSNFIDFLRKMLIVKLSMHHINY